MKRSRKKTKSVPNHYLAGKKDIYFNVEFQKHRKCDKEQEPEGVDCYSDRLKEHLRNGALDAANRFGDLIRKKFHLIPEGDDTEANLTIEFTADGRLNPHTCGVAPGSLDRKRKEILEAM